MVDKEFEKATNAYIDTLKKIKQILDYLDTHGDIPPAKMEAISNQADRLSGELKKINCKTHACLESPETILGDKLEYFKLLKPYLGPDGTNG